MTEPPGRFINFLDSGFDPDVLDSGQIIILAGINVVVSIAKRC